MGKISKTAKASMDPKKKSIVVPCPLCGSNMVATRVIGLRGVFPSGMYWICPSGDYRISTAKKRGALVL